MPAHSSRGKEITVTKSCRRPRLPCGVVRNSQDTTQTKCPWTDKRIKQMRCTCTMEYYLAIKNNKTLPFVTWIKLQGIMLS